ncbi:MAG: glycosyltransferase [Alphaproteobacteria bacterium]|nr:glycosyltransferase [Alphaproteobacteria bacterium]
MKSQVIYRDKIRAMSDLRKISVITIINPGTRFYVTAIKSFVYQTYQDTEWIIIDNTGHNLMASKIRPYLQNDERINFVQNTFVRPKLAVLEQALELAEGVYVAFLDPQDYWTDEKLARQVGFMMRFGTSLSHTSYAFGDDKCHLINIGCYHVSGDYNLLNYRPQNPVAASTLMLNKDRAVLDFSKFDQTENTDLMTFFLKNGLVSSGLTDVLTLCRPIFNKNTQSQIDHLVHELLIANPDDKTTLLRVVEHYAHQALNVENLHLDPGVCIGYEVITSLNKLRNFKV